MTAKRSTLKNVNAAIAAAGFAGYELVKGEGYFYFTGNDAHEFYDSSVAVYRVSDLTIGGWVDELRRKIEKHNRFRTDETFGGADVFFI